MVQTLVCGPLSNNAYLLSSPNATGALLVDAPMESDDAVSKALAEHDLTLETIVLTHSHWDHVADAAALAARTGAALVAHALDAAELARSRRTMLLPGMELPPLAVTRRLEDGDEVRVGAARLTVLHTPGHTPGSICLYCPEAALILAGDTLFAGSYGRVDLPGGDPQRMVASLCRLAALPPQTRVLPGHGAPTSIGAETWLRRL
jgi:glyoxylase-like metal-dependent hydrolase (beta-lactamase superfamily II)